MQKFKYFHFFGMFTSFTNSESSFALNMLNFEHQISIVYYTKYNLNDYFFVFLFGTFEWLLKISTFTKLSFSFIFFNAFCIISSSSRNICQWSSIRQLKLACGFGDKNWETDSGWNNKSDTCLVIFVQTQTIGIDWCVLSYFSRKSLYVDCQNKSIDEKMLQQLFS